MKLHLLKLMLLALVCPLLANAQQTPQAILQKAKSAMGLEQLKKPVLHFYYNEVSLGREQSDRTYAPFFTTSTNAEVWYSPQHNAQRIEQNSIRVGTGPAKNPVVLYKAIGKSYFVRDTTYKAFHFEYDKLNAWMVLLDWLADPTMKQVKNELYRDFDRLVLARKAAVGEERLFIDPKTYFPIKLDYYERHNLWGQQHIEIVYSNWMLTENSFYPNSAFRLEDGEPMYYRTLGKSNLSDSLSLFDKIGSLPTTGPKNVNMEWYSSEQPVLVKVSENTYLSRNRMYTETFTRIGDTIYLLDATLGEERAKQDEQLIKKAFPEVKKFVLVVTDLAWPHIGGMRYWVSKGATVISHAASQKFIEKIVNRKWTIQPDELQQHPVKLKFIALEKMTPFANNQLLVFPINGIGSEGALACYLPQDQLLWASDYIQTAQAPSAYAKEVINAVNREKLKPLKMVAQHVGLTEWQQVLKVNP